MSVYGNDIQDYYIEAFFNSNPEMKQLKSNWKVSNQAQSRKKFKSTVLSDEEYDKVKANLDIIKTSEDYSEYKKAFDRLCYFCHIVPRGIIITKYELKRGTKKDTDDNSLYLEYSENTKKIKIPEGMKLYHISKVPDIKELIPQFRGKSERGYLYDKPRIYFSIKKEIPKIIADYKPGEKMHKYLCLDDIKEVYVDPLLKSTIQGAVYIETTKHIRVEEMGLSGKSKEDTSDKEDENK